jgi:hypothetical protein
MAPLTGGGLLKIMGHVTLIMVVPILGGAVVGLLLDGAWGASPLYVLGGFVVGNLIAITGLWLYIRAFAGRYHGHTDGHSDDA